jgi:hypothetical protein
MITPEEITLAELAVEWSIEYQTRLGAGWNEQDAERAANEWIAELRRNRMHNPQPKGGR